MTDSRLCRFFGGPMDGTAMSVRKNTPVYLCPLPREYPVGYWTAAEPSAYPDPAHFEIRTLRYNLMPFGWHDPRCGCHKLGERWKPDPACTHIEGVYVAEGYPVEHVEAQMRAVLFMATVFARGRFGWFSPHVTALRSVRSDYELQLSRLSSEIRGGQRWWGSKTSLNKVAEFEGVCAAIEHLDGRVSAAIGQEISPTVFDLLGFHNVG